MNKAQRTAPGLTIIHGYCFFLNLCLNKEKSTAMMPPAEAIIIVVCLWLFYIMDKRIQAAPRRDARRGENNRNQLPLDQETIDWAVAYFSRKESRIPEYYLSIGPHLSAEFVADKLLDILKPEEKRLIRDHSMRYGDEIIRILQEKGAISFSKDKQNA